MLGALVLGTLALCGCGGAEPLPPPAEEELVVPPRFSGLEDDLIALAARVRPAVVRVQSESQVFKPLRRYLLGLAQGLGAILNPHPYWEWPYKVIGFPFYVLFGHLDLSSHRGSGFFVAPGKVLTNAHVVENAAEIVLQLTDGRRCRATIALYDDQRDLALLSVEDLQGEPPVPLRLREEGVAQGEVVMAVGFPGREALTDPFMPVFSFDEDELLPNPRVTVGVLSARGVELGNRLTRYLELDAALNPGNSGGPVLGLDGHVVGIATMVGVGKQSEGYAVPNATIRHALGDRLGLAPAAPESGKGKQEQDETQAPTSRPATGGPGGAAAKDGAQAPAGN
ncbi:MAG: S1C family serine protease [Planctomycetota bacterium]